jgi:hypothetical protein
MALDMDIRKCVPPVFQKYKLWHRRFLIILISVDVSEEYTKITTPRQDVLFKKGYLGRKRSTATPTADTTANVHSSNTNLGNTAADVANGNFSVNGTAEQNGGGFVKPCL